MINSESQFVAPGGSSVVVLLKIDPRPEVQKLYDMHLPVSFAGGSYNKTIRNGYLTSMLTNSCQLKDYFLQYEGWKIYILAAKVWQASLW